MRAGLSARSRRLTILMNSEAQVDATRAPLINHHAAGRDARGVRLIALFEATKGALVLIAGCGLLSLIHRDLQATAEHLVRFSHLNPAHHYPRIFLESAARLDDKNLLMLAGAALAYSTLRFVEAYGLWRARAWAEWLAIISGAIYLPLEIYELFKRATLVRASVLIINSLIVCYLLYRRRKLAQTSGESH